MIPLARTRRAAVPRSAASKLASYTDATNVLTLLGPRGFKCIASFTADGGGSSVLYPASSRAPPFFPKPIDHRHLLGVSMFFASTACSGCVFVQACPYFALARRLYIESGYYDSARTCSRPRGDRLGPPHDFATRFLDPAWVPGSGYLSGGPLAAIGVAYFNPASPPSAYVETCTLPSSDRSVCGIIEKWLLEHLTHS